MERKKIIFLAIILVCITILLGIGIWSTRKQEPLEENQTTPDEYMPPKEVKEIVENVTIQGIVELHHNGFIYVNNGEHFSEYGFEMDEYTSIHIPEKQQECVDALTGEKIKITDIQEGDILIVTGDQIKYTRVQDELDTKENPIKVIKKEAYDLMKKEVLKKETEVATVRDYFENNGELYLRYENKTKEYNLPFAVKVSVPNQIEEKIKRGTKVKVQYINLENIEQLEVKAIQVVEE